MFDLPPPRHISTLRILPVAGRPFEGPLTEPVADTRACRWQLAKMPLMRHSPTPARLSQVGAKAA